MALSVKTFNSDSILNIVDSLRADGTSASFCFNTAEHPLSGKQCLIYAVKFPDDATWAVRIPAHTSHLPQEAITDYLKTEISILKNLETRGFSWSPRLLGYDCGFNNPLEFPYLVLSWIEGKPLEWSDTVPSQRENRNKILHQLANIILEMAESTKESSSIITIKYLTDIIDRKIVRVYDGKTPDLKLRDCFIQRALARKAVYSGLNESSHTVISHGDLAAQNIIIDSDYNIKGIIDWGFASRLPLQFAVSFPRFLAIEPQIDAPIPPDVVAFSSDFLQPSPVLQTDRQHLVENLLNRFETETLAQPIQKFLSASDVDWRSLIFEAASSKGLHKWMINVNWLLRDIPISPDLEEEVKDFFKDTVEQKKRISQDILIKAIKEKDKI